jgi:hypothetical protein
VKLVQKGIEAEIAAVEVLRFGNEQTARCSLILLARWTCPLIPLMRHYSIFPIIRRYPKYNVMQQ